MSENVAPAAGKKLFFLDPPLRRISTLTTISGHLKGIVSHKNTQYYKLYVYFKLSVYISRDFSLPLAIPT